MKYNTPILTSLVKTLRPLGLSTLSSIRAALLLTPLFAIGAAAETTQPVQQPKLNVPAKADLPDAAQYQSKGFNVLFIAVDDLNDWVGCFGGNPQAITPNMDRLAKQQAMVMNKAYAPSTVCCPSRSALLTGMRTASIGVYGNRQNIKSAPKAKDVVTLPQYFSQHGYHTLSTGKIFHKHPAADGMDEGQWAFNEYATPPGGGNGGMLWEKSPSTSGVSEKGEEFRWGAVKAPVQKTKDYISCKWAADQLQRDFGGKPFFLALGLSKPHLPWEVPQEFFDLYPLDKLKPVEIVRDDLDDIVGKNGKQLFRPDPRFLAADSTNLHLEAQRAYLANISYVDHCLGVLFDALAKSKYAENTIIMLWGDHGWHLSEKMKYGKTDLWEETCRVPLIVRVPGVTKSDFKCEGVVNLLDMYPTLVELCGLPANAENEGRSFAPLLKNPSMEWNVPTLTTYQYKNHSFTDGRYRYTYYGGKAGGAEELYDHSVDPLEHKNLAANPESQEIIARFKKYLPTHDEPDAPSNKLSGADKRKMRKGQAKER
ncbi:MAG: sulfatase [Akkermansiaceae bacterium]|nr:sulfatase [Akkermansiaceae bacterium]